MRLNYAMRKTRLLTSLYIYPVCALGMVLFFISPFLLNASIIDDLRQKIDGKGTEIAALEAEIAQFEKEISNLGSQASSLANSIKVLDITRKKLEADIRLTEGKISSETLTIQKLEIEINDKQGRIERDTSAIFELLRIMDEDESKTLIELLLASENMSQVWDDIENVVRLQKILRDNIAEVKTLKAAREQDKTATEQKRATLVSLKKQLADQKKVVESNKAEKNRLLTTTKNQEANYKKLLAQKLALKNAFEEELRAFETELKIAIDPNSLPAKGSGVLSWPVDNVRITQYFGNTAFAQSGAYNGSGHNGIDLGAGYGTPIKSAAGGTIAGTGDTDLVCRGASYGKWVLVTHRNGLSTLYAHLSVISVSKGQEIGTGGILGYSGDSGYSTGPHLHFTVYATQGVNVEARKSKVCGGTYTLPIAPLNAYLNPMDYLKKL